MASVWATFSPKNYRKMTKKFVNKLIQKSKENEELLLVKITEPAKDLSQEELHQMNDNILNYSSGRMTIATKEKCEFHYDFRGIYQLK